MRNIRKLYKYVGYKKPYLRKWKKQIKLPEVSIQKIINRLEILSRNEIRDLLKGIVRRNRLLFDDKDSYITNFGSTGDSGALVLYEFKHTFKQYRKKIVEIWDIPKLPPISKIIFVDDLVGSGNQSIQTIKTRLSAFMNPSHQGYLVCLCATPQGIVHVEANTGVKILTGRILIERLHQYLHPNCAVFNRTEKDYLLNLNGKLNNPPGGYGNMGLLLGFYFSIPNNTLPFIWKSNSHYQDQAGSNKTWFPLLPRDS